MSPKNETTLGPKVGERENRVWANEQGFNKYANKIILCSLMSSVVQVLGLVDYLGLVSVLDI